jgi:ubiquinone/menaquinone biosynthesis C-methylase UbiE
MEQSEMVALIRAGVQPGDRLWADLGAGTGNFTFALRALLPAQATIYAFDRDARAVEAIGRRLRDAPAGPAIQATQADVTWQLDLPAQGLDGVLMANLLHFIRDQAGLLARVARYLAPGGRLLVVEYDQQLPAAWVPFPVPVARLATLAASAGLPAALEIGRRRSPSSGRDMYAALIVMR